MCSEKDVAAFAYSIKEGSPYLYESLSNGQFTLMPASKHVESVNIHTLRTNKESSPELNDVISDNSCNSLSASKCAINVSTCVIKKEPLPELDDTDSDYSLPASEAGVNISNVSIKKEPSSELNNSISDCFCTSSLPTLTPVTNIFVNITKKEPASESCTSTSNCSRKANRSIHDMYCSSKNCSQRSNSARSVNIFNNDSKEISTSVLYKSPVNYSSRSQSVPKPAKSIRSMRKRCKSKLRQSSSNNSCIASSNNSRKASSNNSRKASSNNSRKASSNNSRKASSNNSRKASSSIHNLYCSSAGCYHSARSVSAFNHDSKGISTSKLYKSSVNYSRLRLTTPQLKSHQLACATDINKINTAKLYKSATTYSRTTVPVSKKEKLIEEDSKEGVTYLSSMDILLSEDENCYSETGALPFIKQELCDGNDNHYNL